MFARREQNLASALGKKKFGVTMHFSEIKSFNLEEKRHTLLSILPAFF